MMHKISHDSRVPRAFTLIELLTVIAIIGILAAILIPVVGKVRESARGSACASNVRQILTGLHLYAVDHGDRFPATQNSELEVGPFGVPQGQNTWHAYIAAYVGLENVPFLPRPWVTHSHNQQPTVFNCPATLLDVYPLPGKENAPRPPQWYSYGLNSDLPGAITGRDRRSGVTISVGQVVNPSQTMAILETSDWTAAHAREIGIGLAMVPHGGGSNVGFYDGSVQRFSAAELMEIPGDDVFWRGGY